MIGLCLIHRAITFGAEFDFGSLIFAAQTCHAYFKSSISLMKMTIEWLSATNPDTPKIQKECQFNTFLEDARHKEQA
jgi:hypothetical protein